uniref:Uncharacterized protein n=1 Tax=Chromera velia CCMP2878 TaxID=1169474 RepID=A0A0G4GZ23_9ALVE|eukprot:Cvel_23997.t1-p1 / transcript=Cvel_23997.t1 / gene=Cvel_23997 / organism=Chromera_velia_CCMP2878 / gene_product=hypothetical protein / transcript_product=hypothetical protein / location=Cvel_scaffold2543:18061-18258(+) / protein_length=66 / sequence_SO=supercontig / SO=protein_coding / is_pseudo=false
MGIRTVVQTVSLEVVVVSACVSFVLVGPLSAGVVVVLYWMAFLSLVAFATPSGIFVVRLRLDSHDL